MRLINLTFKKYPAYTADAIYVRELSKGFTEALGDNYLLVAIQDKTGELGDVPHLIAKTFFSSYRSVFYFLWIPYLFIFKERWGNGRVIFSNDSFLLTSLIIWQKIFFFRYKLCADWHMISGSWKEKFMLKHLNKNVTTTEHLKNNIIKKYKISSDNIKTIYGGVNIIEGEKTRKELKLPDDKKLVAYVGFFKTLGMEKGIKTMIDSLEYVDDKDVQMVFIGGRDEEIFYYRHYAEKKGLADRCTFIGRVPTDEVSFYQKAVDVLVIPYPDEPHFREYGFPMKVYEYMASGRPIVYSNLPIMSEVLADIATPFEPGNPKDFVRAISEINSSSSDEAMSRARSLTWIDKAQSIVNYISHE